MSQDRNERGRFTETTTLADVLAVFDSVDGPVVTSADVADATGCSRDSARRKLDQLVERGRVASRKTAGRVVYWLADGNDPAPVDPADPLFADRPTVASGRDDLSERHDEVLYGTDR
ncbi:MAG: hypothetical protein V5A37_07330 [Halobacteriales archaeon]